MTNLVMLASQVEALDKVASQVDKALVALKIFLEIFLETCLVEALVVQEEALERQDQEKALI